MQGSGVALEAGEEPLRFDLNFAALPPRTTAAIEAVKNGDVCLEMSNEMLGTTISTVTTDTSEASTALWDFYTKEYFAVK